LAHHPGEHFASGVILYVVKKKNETTRFGKIVYIDYVINEKFVKADKT